MTKWSADGSAKEAHRNLEDMSSQVSRPTASISGNFMEIVYDQTDLGLPIFAAPDGGPSRPA